MPLNARDPRKTTSYGVGELIRCALDLGATQLLIGCGDSGVSDGGIGLAEALGARPLNRMGAPLAAVAARSNVSHQSIFPVSIHA